MVGSTVVVWEVSGCRDSLQVVHQEGVDVEEMRACEDGKSIMADLYQFNVSSFRSTLNITGVQFTNLTVRCLSDNGSSEFLTGMDELISTGMLLASNN